MKIVIKFKFTTLNEYISYERSPNRFGYIKANKIKKSETDLVSLICKNKKWDKYPCKLTFIWHTPNKRKDLDNITFAKKFIIDGLVKGGTIKNDNLNYVQAFEDKVVFNKEEYVIVEISEV